jgi:DNA invertase Pin-like site-specific DNA recombinase
MAAVGVSDPLVGTKLDRLARSLPDARDIADEITPNGVALSLGGSVYDPTDPVGRLLFSVLSMVAKFEGNLIRLRTREGMAVAKAKGRLRGKSPSSPPPSVDTYPTCTTRATTRRKNSPSCSTFLAPRFTARYSDEPPTLPRGARGYG